jgi:hypothetical protein
MNGVYKREPVPLSKLQAKQNSTWKRHDHNRQRKDYASEIVQPYDRTGKPSDAFIENYPEEAVDYGFLPSEAELLGVTEEQLQDKGAQMVAADDEQLQALIPDEEYIDG